MQRYFLYMTRTRNSLVHSLAALIALTLALSAFAHRAAPAVSLNGAADGGIDLSDYRLPDGSLPDICLGSGSDPAASGEACDFCTLAHGTALPGANALHPAPMPSSCTLQFPLTAQVTAPFGDPARSVRGPPFRS